LAPTVCYPAQTGSTPCVSLNVLETVALYQVLVTYDRERTAGLTNGCRRRHCHSRQGSCDEQGRLSAVRSLNDR